MSKNRVIQTALIAATLIALAVPAAAQTTVDVSYTWTAPTSGSAVDHYVVEHRVNGGAWVQIATTSTNSYTLTATYGQTHEIRVAGVDAQDRQGVFSVASDPYTPDPGAPGAPGKPIPF
jgi:endonuclease YncB( thermonuclease family)